MTAKGTSQNTGDLFMANPTAELFGNKREGKHHKGYDATPMNANVRTLLSGKGEKLKRGVKTYTTDSTQENNSLDERKARAHVRVRVCECCMKVCTCR